MTKSTNIQKTISSTYFFKDKETVFKCLRCSVLNTQLYKKCSSTFYKSNRSKKFDMQKDHLTTKFHLLSVQNVRVPHFT